MSECDVNISRGYAVQVPDFNYWCAQIKCQSACPVRTDSRAYVRAIAAGQDEYAYLIARGPNPLASICGRVCGAPCEKECRRGALDESIAIRMLKRFVCDQFGPEARPDGGLDIVELLKTASMRNPSRQCQDREELLPMLQALTADGIPKVKGKSVGIIGGGPAGLAAAHDLVLMGFDVTIYEMEPMLAGMLVLGVPEYRLPRDLVRAEVEVVLAMGVKSQTNCCVGKDVTLAELRKRHDVTVIAVGAKRSRRLPVPGADAEGVIGGVEFLRDVALSRPLTLGKRVVVIGGGNVAYDVGRTVLRQISMDTARTAVREAGVNEVYLCSLESLEEMPADDLEIIEGDEEGVIRRNGLGPKEIVKDEKGRVCAVRFQRCKRVYDEQRRFSPVFDPNDITEISCDNVLIAVGQSYDLSFVDETRDGLKLGDRGQIVCAPDSGVTSANDVFVAGDLAYGPKLLIHAVASGKAVARSIYRKVTGRAICQEEIELHFPIPDYDREADYEKLKRTHPSSSPVAERLKGQDRLVENGFEPHQARMEASRCLDCGVNTIFNGERCILCGGCVDVCPQTCLRIVAPAQLAGDDKLQGVVDRTLDQFPRDEASAIIKDETVCIRCGLCAERCPVGAITMERFQYEEKPICQAV